MHRITRRDWLKGAAASMVVADISRLESHVSSQSVRRSDLDIAIRAERWLKASRIPTPNGIAWPSNPLLPNTVVRNLYSGTPGVVLFLLELHHATGERAYLDEARLGADDIAANLAGPDHGLYTGVAGRTFALAETWRATGDAQYRDAARRGVTLLRDKAMSAGTGVEWSQSNDIISGTAGIALFLLYAARTLDDAGAVDLALRAARRLSERGVASDGGLTWRISPSTPLQYPNFSHGAAGVSYALATVHAATGDRPLLDAALAGARYLDAVTDQAGGGCRIFHHDPGGRELYYLSWCHGGPGTARRYQRLHAITRDAAWRSRVDCVARGVTAMGAPVARSPGYWNNISQCCGNAGVGEFFLSLHALDPARGHLDVARRAADDIIARGTVDGAGSKWVQAENRVSPAATIAQTGYMQGAAGVGMFFLRLDSQASRRAARITMPDSPFV